jgi:DNA-binding PadR family transcriptional regulator
MTSAPALYPVLHSLATSRYLRRLDRVVNGKVHKYYQITPAGRQALASAKKQIRELVDEVLQDRAALRSAGPRRPAGGRQPPQPRGRRPTAARIEIGH